MTDKNQHVLIRLIPEGECIAIRTFNREIGRRGRFLNYPRLATEMVEQQSGACVL